MKILYGLLILFVLQFCVATVPSLNRRIVGGHPIPIERVPYQISLQIASKHHCGGSIVSIYLFYIKKTLKKTINRQISPKIIITAAHCVQKFNASAYSVCAGTNFTENCKQNMEIANIVEHPKFGKIENDYDIALLFLKKPLNFNKKVKPIALPGRNAVLKKGTMCIVSGWGDTHTVHYNRHLMGVQVPIVEQKQCKMAYAKHGEITSRMICAGFKEGKKDSCWV